MQQHGGAREAEMRAAGLDPASVIDFSASINPYGPSPRVWQAMAAVDLARYPDPDVLKLTEALADRHGLPPDHILVGNGGNELIHLVVRALVRARQRPVVFTPTFGEFERACTLVGASIFPWHANAHRGFTWTLRNKADVLRRVQPPLLYLCNPNNPTGTYLSRQEVGSIVSGLSGGPLLLDEAYIDFIESPWDATPLIEDGRVLLLRSMTKQYALAGVRLGYLVARPEMIAAVRRLQPEWSVSSLAQAAGLAALADDDYLRETTTLVRDAKAGLTASLADIGASVHEGAANFLLIEVGDATAVRAALLRQGLLVRDCASFGLPSHIRVGVRTPAENARLIDALAACIGAAAVRA